MFTRHWRSQPDGEAETGDSEFAVEEFVTTAERELVVDSSGHIRPTRSKYLKIPLDTGE